MIDRPLRLRLVPWMVAGVESQYVHLERELRRLHVDSATSEVHPWVDGGSIERLPLPSRTKGTLRSLLTVRRAVTFPSDAIWTQVALPLLPFLLGIDPAVRAPVFYAIDCTPKSLFELGPSYRAQSTNPKSLQGRVKTAALRSFFRRCAGLLPWSNWAAQSMVEDYDADPAKVHVLAPGIDTVRWAVAEPSPRSSSKVQLLFVGGDFDRKGGPLLLDIYRRHLSAECDLHVVTRTGVSPEPGVTVHSGYKPDDDALLTLFQAADILVVPTLADCFSMAAIEAMSCGKPVITSQVGGISEIVSHGTTGYLLSPGDGRALLIALRRLIADDGHRARLGHAGRDAAVARFDAAIQARALLRVVLTAIEEGGLRSSHETPLPRSSF